jgi:hypothetical protein
VSTFGAVQIWLLNSNVGCRPRLADSLISVPRIASDWKLVHCHRNSHRNSIRLLIAAALGVGSCASVPSGADAVVTYRSESGEIARLNLQTLTIQAGTVVLRFADCSDAHFVCWDSPHARIEVPRQCPTAEDLVAYMRDSGRLRFLSLEGLSGNIFKYEASSRKFGYGYNPTTGLVQLIIIPPAQGLHVDEADQHVRPFIYRNVSKRAPFPCR